MKDFVKKVLSNGLVVYFYKNKTMKRVLVSYNIRYGSDGYFDQFYYDGKYYKLKPGMAHFLEHTLIEMCKYGNMIHKFLDKNYDFNGITYSDITTFYFVGIKGIKESTKELIEMVDDPVFDRDAIENVKRAIIDEVRKNDDAKYRLAFNINIRNLYKGYEAYPKHGNQLGSTGSTREITYEDAKACYDAYYNIENKFLVIAGNVDVDDYVYYLEEIFSHLKAHPNKMKPMEYENYLEVRKKYQEVVKRVDQDYLIATYKIRSEEDPLLLDLALFIFLRSKFSNDTKFVTNLVEDKIIIGGIGWDTTYVRGDTLITFSADVLNKEEFMSRLDTELSDRKIDTEKFKLIHRNLIANQLAKLDNIYAQVKKYPLDICYSDKLFVLDLLKKTTYEEVSNIIASLNFDVKSVVLVTNKNRE
ncbi:MAG TPA: hypothetical protein DCY94_04115 [Firmicutes bacterium]|nr:hypothetical protein [Bacillota bacterium]